MMKRIIYLFLFFVLIPFLSACTGGSLISLGTPKDLLTNIEVSTYDYNATETLARIKAQIGNASKVVPLHEVTFYANSTCDVPELGKGLVQDLASTGIDFRVPIGTNIKIYFTLNTDEDCYFLKDYNVDIALSPSINFIKTSPVSPSRTSFRPAVFAELFPSSGTVDLFSDDTCTTLLTSSSHDPLLNAGVQITLLAETTNNIYAKAKDLLGQESSCQHLTAYIHTTAVAPKATFHSATPASPQNSTTTPLIRGTVANSITLVRLYSNSSCSQSIGTGPASAFTNPGLEASIAENATTQIYARTEDAQGLKSSCIFLTAYTHDSVAPLAPSFVSANPASPTRLTTFPKIRGTAASDVQVVRFYDSTTCQSNKVIGWNTRLQFTVDGINANLPSNKTTAIYAVSVDAAGNSSDCTFLTNYRHNTIPPAPPVFLTTDPLSPNNFSTTPKAIGMPAEHTKTLHFYRDEFCTVAAGSGTAAEFEGAGITITALNNTSISVYATAEDAEGNNSECTFMTSYAHSNVPATNVGFTIAYPASPTRVTASPYLVGTADNTIISVQIFSDNSCTQVVGSGTRSAFVSAGIMTNIPQNATTSLYAVATNIYGNISSCSLLTSYTHSILPPLAPTLTSVTPLSPNNTSSQPTIRGNSFQNPASPLPPTRVVFYDSNGCVSNIGEGTPSNFSSTGIQINLPENAVSFVYAKSFDAAFNGSDCVFISNYVHNNLNPGYAIHVSATPNTPSYTTFTLLKGNYAYSPDFMDKVSIEFFSDSLCTQLITSGSPTQYTAAGIGLTVPLNTTTPVYARTYNEIGNRSTCSFLISYKHSDVGPSNLNLTQNPDGSLRLTWTADMASNPAPTYIVKRSLQAGGPYTIVSSGSTSTFYVDNSINHGQSYYYRVQSTNSTGFSKDSAEVSATVNSTPPSTALSLTAVAGSNEARLTWTGFIQNMSYKVQRSTQAGGPYTLIASSLKTISYTDETVLNNNVYFYRVIAVNPFGESIASNEAQVVPLGPPPKVEYVWLVPQRSSPNCGGSPGVHIHWTPAQYNDGGYEIWRQSNGSANIGSTSQNEYVDCNPSNSAINRYTIVTKWGSYNSLNSDEVRFYNDGYLSHSVFSGNNHILVNWPTIGSSNRYDLYRSSSRAGPFQAILQNSTALTYTDSSVINGQGYFYYAQARLGTYYVGWPSLVVGGTASNSPAAPAHLIVTENGSGQPVLNWAAPSNFNRFLVYRASNSGGPFTFLSYSSSTEFTDTAPMIGMNYYQVSAQWGNSQTAYSNSVSFRRAPLLSLTATRNAGNITLDWSGVSDISDYRVERATDRQGPYTSIAFPVTNIFVDTTALPNVGYYYRVSARFADLTEGQLSSVVGAMLTGATTPTGLSLLGMTGSSVNVGWIPTPGATSYLLYRSTSSGGPYTLVTTVGSAVAAYNFSGLTARTQYYFKVASLISGVEYPSSEFSQATLPKPSAPLGEIGNALVNLTWTPLTDVQTYNVERSTDKINFTAVATGLSSSSYTNTGLTNGQIYFYRIVGIYALGSATSDISSSFTPGVQTLAPAGLHIESNTTGTSINLGWVPSTGATSYYVYMSTTPGGPYGAPQLSTGSTSGVSISGLNPNTVYYFVVTSRVGTLESGFSSEVSARTTSTHLAPIASYQSASAIQLSWSAVPGASSYNIERSIDQINFSTIATSVAGTSYVDSSFAAGKSYSYRYRPNSASGFDMSVSAVSNIITVDIQPLAPIGIRLWGQSLTSVRVSWSRVPDAISYQVYRSTTSGSGYSLVQTIADPNFTWTNTGLTGGTTYYYVIRSVNVSGVPSADSEEKSIRLISGPTGLAATNNGSLVDLSWNSVATATSYNIYRSDVSGGPYGLIATSSTLTAQDSQVTPNVTYYYVVDAQFASGVKSVPSSQVSFTKIGGLKFQVPIEMVDRGLSSKDSESKVFNRSLTPINTNDYDGIVSYSIELVATNSESISRAVQVVDGSNTVLATINVPGLTFDPTRFETSFTPNAGANSLKLRLAQTAMSETLSVYSARVLISQQNASKTRIYYPLISTSFAPTSDDEDAFVIFTNNTAYERIADAMPYSRKTQLLSKISDFNAWRLDVLAYTDPGVEGVLKLQNVSSSSIVANQQTEIKNNSLQLAQIPIQEGSLNFGPANENHYFEPQMRCTVGCALGQVRLLKAGLWVSLKDLTKLQISYRTSLGAEVSSNTELSGSRISLDLSKFTLPQVYFQTSATITSGNAEVVLRTASTLDSGPSLTDIADSNLNFTGNSNKQTQITFSPLAISSGDRLITTVRSSGSTLRLHGSQLLIRVGQ